MFYFKSGSSARTVLVGRASAVKNIRSKSGIFTCITLQTREIFTGKDGVAKENVSTVPVYLEGEHNIPTNSLIHVSGDLSVCMVAPKSDQQKYEIIQEAVRNAKFGVLANETAGDITGINEATLIGRVGSVRELKSAKGAGTAISLAVSRTEKNGNRTDSVTDWHEITFWGYRAEAIGKLGIGKGDLLLCKGRLSVRPVKVNGTERNLLAFMAEDFNLLYKKSQAPVPQAAPVSSPAADSTSTSDEVPFF